MNLKRHTNNNNNNNKTKQKNTWKWGILKSTKLSREKQCSEICSITVAGQVHPIWQFTRNRKQRLSEGPGQSSGCRCSRIRNLSQAQWHVPIIPSTREAKVGFCLCKAFISCLQHGIHLHMASQLRRSKQCTRRNEWAEPMASTSCLPAACQGHGRDYKHKQTVSPWLESERSQWHVCI